jgi:hypothetical protein
MISGVNDFGAQCFWTYGASTPEEAENTALLNCYSAGLRCFTYFRSDFGNSAWVQNIANMGGDDGTAAAAATAEAFGSMLGTIIGGATNRGGGYAPPTTAVVVILTGYSGILKAH